MKTFLFLCFFIFMGSVPVPEAQSSTSQQRQIREEELSKLLKFYKSISRLQVQFKQTKILKDLNLQLKSEGRLSLTRPDQVIWEIFKPSRVTVKLNQNEIQIQSGEGPESSVQTLKKSEMPKDESTKSLGGLVAWLQLDAHALSQQYLIYATQARSFKFTPREQTKSVFKDLEMKLTSSGHLQSLLIHEISGDLLEIQFGTPQITETR